MLKLQIVSRSLPITIAMALTLVACSAEEEEAPELITRVVGTLAQSDLAAAQAAHDQVAAGGEAQAREAGDIGHDAMLGTTLLGTVENHFLAIDRWNDLDGMTGFYSNPDVAAGFAALFDGQPSIEQFEWQPDWHGWGDLSAGDNADPYFFVMVRGRLADEGDDARIAHDAIAAGGEAAALAAGDVAHVVFLKLDDPQEYLAFDIWTDDANLEAFYSNPDFQQGVASLFDGEPTIGVYQSTDWHQW